MREVWGSITGSVKLAQCRQRLATTATFLRSCVALALSRGDRPRSSLHASAQHRECKGVARKATGAMPPPQSILDKNKDLRHFNKYLPLRDCFLAGLLISGLTKEKYNTTLLFV